MNMIRITLAIAAIGCLSLTAVYAADSARSRDTSAKHSSSMHRNSTGGAGVRDSDNRSSRSSSGRRSHTSHRASSPTSRTHDRLRPASNRDATRAVQGSAQPGEANDQAELPRRENEDEPEDDDANAILMGTGAENDDAGSSRP